MSEEIKVDDTQTTEEQSGEVKENLLTQDQVNEIIADRLKRERSKWEEKIEEEKKLAQMSAEEKAEELRRRKEEELAERERSLMFKELEIDTKHTLAEKGIPETFSRFLIQNDKDATSIAIDEFSKTWEETINKRVEKEVEERLKGKDQTREVSVPKVESKDKDKDMISKLAREVNIRGNV